MKRTLAVIAVGLLSIAFDFAQGGDERGSKPAGSGAKDTGGGHIPAHGPPGTPAKSAPRAGEPAPAQYLADRPGHPGVPHVHTAILEFLDTKVFNVSIENCVSFLDPIIDSWDIDLKTFGMEIVLNRRLAPGGLKRFEFVEQEPPPAFAIEPGFEQFLLDKSLSGDATEEELEFLKMLKFKGRRPAPLYYYRELQSLRDPLHFLPGTL